MTTSTLQTQRNFNFLWSCKRNIHAGQHEAKKAPSQTIIYHNRTAWHRMRIIKFSVGSLKCHFHNQQLDSLCYTRRNPPSCHLSDPASRAIFLRLSAFHTKLIYYIFSPPFSVIIAKPEVLLRAPPIFPFKAPQIALSSLFFSPQMFFGSIIIF